MKSIPVSFLSTACLALTLFACSAKNESANANENTSRVQQRLEDACTAPFSFPFPTCLEMGCTGFGYCPDYTPVSDGVSTYICCPRGMTAVMDGANWVCDGTAVDCP